MPDALLYPLLAALGPLAAWGASRVRRGPQFVPSADPDPYHPGDPGGGDQGDGIRVNPGREEF